MQQDYRPGCNGFSRSRHLNDPALNPFDMTGVIAMKTFSSLIAVTTFVLSVSAFALPSQQQDRFFTQTLGYQQPVAADGTDRTPGQALAADGSDRTMARRLA